MIDGRCSVDVARWRCLGRVVPAFKRYSFVILDRSVVLVLWDGYSTSFSSHLDPARAVYDSLCAVGCITLETDTTYSLEGSF